MQSTIVDAFTDQEFDVLAEVINIDAVSSRSQARSWLRAFDPRPVKEFLTLPLEEMCLYINDDYGPQKYVALWRLKIGR